MNFHALIVVSSQNKSKFHLISFEESVIDDLSAPLGLISTETNVFTEFNETTLIISPLATELIYFEFECLVYHVMTSFTLGIVVV
jgi:hypothetical protein